MSGIRPHLSHQGPNTYPVSAAVKGGQLVAPTTGKNVGPAGAASPYVLGVAEIDARPFQNAVSVDSDGFDTIIVSPLPQEVSVGFGRYEVTFAANAGFGQALKSAANGAVTPLLDADPAGLKVGYCDEPGGVVVATKSKGFANISR